MKTARLTYVDTQDLARELNVNAPLGLERLGIYLGLNAMSHSHNAGNDAAYTLKVYFKLEARFEMIVERKNQANRCPNCSSTDHSVPTTECMGI